MNKGDKVICIKNLFLKQERDFFKGNIYEIYDIYDDEGLIAIVNYKEGIFLQQNIFYLTESPIKYFELFSEYFMTMAEWGPTNR
jgi:hypothetical protein